jgi:large conductance mechanosensitive channel
VTQLLEDFKKFLLQGNLVTLAVAFVIGTAFAALVKALVTDLIMPIVAMIIGKPDFSSLHFTINSSIFAYGDFINVAITFVSIAAAVFFLVVKPYEMFQAVRVKEDPTVKACPECTTEIPAAAKRCPQCTAVLRT